MSCKENDYKRSNPRVSIGPQVTTAKYTKNAKLRIGFLTHF